MQKLTKGQQETLVAIARTTGARRQVDVRADARGVSRAPGGGITVNLATARALERRGLLSIGPAGMYRRQASPTAAGRELAAELAEAEA